MVNVYLGMISYFTNVYRGPMWHIQSVVNMLLLICLLKLYNEHCRLLLFLLDVHVWINSLVVATKTISLCPSKDLQMLIHEKRYEKFERTHIYGTRATLKIHRFLTHAKELFLGNSDNLEQCLSRISLGRSGSLQKGFIKLSSQFIFSREQSTFVISYISLLWHLTKFPPHLFAKSRSTVVKSHLVCWPKWQ